MKKKKTMYIEKCELFFATKTNIHTSCMCTYSEGTRKKILIFKFLLFFKFSNTKKKQQQKNN